MGNQTKRQKKIWFTADLHIGHENIIKFCDRPFETPYEMDEEIIRMWNERVHRGDDVYILGDVGMCSTGYLCSVLQRLNGNKMLIAGNHDKGHRKKASFKKCFSWIKDVYTVKVPDEDAFLGKQRIFLFHYACRTWDGSHHGVWHCYGHSHGTLPGRDDQLSIDVGVDVHNYVPISYEELKAIMTAKELNHDTRFGY